MKLKKKVWKKIQLEEKDLVEKKKKKIKLNCKEKKHRKILLEKNWIENKIKSVKKEEKTKFKKKEKKKNELKKKKKI